MGMEEEQRRSDYCEWQECCDAVLVLTTVLGSEQACDIALEYGFNPVVDDEKSFDILPQ
jgi:translation initiation factor IF-2